MYFSWATYNFISFDLRATAGWVSPNAIVGLTDSLWKLTSIRFDGYLVTVVNSITRGRGRERDRNRHKAVRVTGNLHKFSNWRHGDLLSLILERVLWSYSAVIARYHATVHLSPDNYVFAFNTFPSHNCCRSWTPHQKDVRIIIYSKEGTSCCENII